jgi:tetratricopeptide (TPR) repeat protein
MKLCPFISHMLGEENANTLTAITEPTSKKSRSRKNPEEDANGVVILGYDDGDGGWEGNVQTETITKTSSQTMDSVHLMCLKEPCRFYQKKGKSCMFDSMHDLLKSQKEKAPVKSREKPAPADPKLTKELEKVWKLQTKSVAEMIASIGEAEKNQKKSLDLFKTELGDQIESILAREQENDQPESVLNTEIEKLKEVLEDREEAIENFSTTLSETVVNIEETLDKLSEKINQVSEGFENLMTMEENLSSWRDDLDEKVDDLMDRQSTWDDHFTTLQGQQDELKDYFEWERERQQAAETKDKKKEAKRHNNLGVTSFHNGSYDLAKNQFLQAVKLDDESAEAYNNLGLACTELGDEEEATEAFKKAIHRNPGLAAAYTNLGYVFYRQGSYEEAIDMYNDALGRNSDNSSAYTNLGNAYYKLGKLDQAREAWNKSIEIDPGNERARRYLERLKTK